MTGRNVPVSPQNIDMSGRCAFCYGTLGRTWATREDFALGTVYKLHTVCAHEYDVMHRRVIDNAAEVAGQILERLENEATHKDHKFCKQCCRCITCSECRCPF